MSIRTRILVASLAVNAVLLWRWSQEVAELREDQTAKASEHSETLRPKPGETNGGASTDTRSSPDPVPHDLSALRDSLRALGLTDEEVRMGLKARLEARRHARQQQWVADLSKSLPWWQGGIGTQDLTEAQNREVRAARQAEREELARLLGPIAISPRDLERYSYLPADKAAALIALQRDYADMREDTGTDILHGAKAEQARKLLEAEHDQDLTALLTPDERTALDMRESRSARTLSRSMELFDATEAEYRALFALQKNYDDAHPPSPAMMMDRERSQALQRLQQDFASALGPDRSAEWQYAQRNDYRVLVDLQRRFQIPQETFRQVAKIPTDLGIASMQVERNSELTPDQKVAALAELAAKTRTDVRGLLGPDAGDAYLATTGARWIELLDRGTAYEFTGGSGMRSRSVAAKPGRPAGP